MNDSDYHCARQIGVTKAIIVPIISLCKTKLQSISFFN